METRAPLAFVDTETTGLDPDRHGIWEVGLILDDGFNLLERRWFLPVTLHTADAVALNIGGFWDRYPSDVLKITDLKTFADSFSRFTWGAHLVGAVISFDEERLRKLLRANGACPGWHYHIIDVEALAVGYLGGLGEQTAPPWNSRELSKAVGVDPERFSAHEALEDARWARAVYNAVLGVDDHSLTTQRSLASVSHE